MLNAKCSPKVLSSFSRYLKVVLIPVLGWVKYKPKEFKPKYSCSGKQIYCNAIENKQKNNNSVSVWLFFIYFIYKIKKLYIHIDLECKQESLDTQNAFGVNVPRHLWYRPDGSWLRIIKTIRLLDFSCERFYQEHCVLLPWCLAAYIKLWIYIFYLPHHPAHR